MLTPIRILSGYAAAVAGATAMLWFQLRLLWPVDNFGWRDMTAAAAIIGVFGAGGLIFAILAERRGWTRMTTFLAGGFIAMLLGVGGLFAMSVLRAVLHRDWTISIDDVGGFLIGTSQLVALGTLPGLAAGLTYWLVAVRQHTVR